MPPMRSSACWRRLAFSSTNSSISPRIFKPTCDHKEGAFPLPLAQKRVGKGAPAPCPPLLCLAREDGGHAEPVIGRALRDPVVCPPYQSSQYTDVSGTLDLTFAQRIRV